MANLYIDWDEEKTEQVIRLVSEFFRDPMAQYYDEDRKQFVEDLCAVVEPKEDESGNT